MPSIRFLNNIRGILLLALVLRIIAAIFAKGYAFHDDHFCVLRVAESWSEGIGHWVEADTPPKHSMIYAAASAVIISAIKFFGIADPVIKAMILQMIHGIYSLLIVYLGYRITLKLSNNSNALLVALVLSVLWFMPYLGVKFMAEIVCLPPLMYAFSLYLNEKDKRPLKWVIIGVMIGLAFSVRMHTILIAGGMGLILLYRRQYQPILMIIGSFIATTFLTIALFDILFFNYPYEYIINYFAYNSENAYNYITGSPIKFLGTTAGFLVPPVSLMLLWGYGRSFKTEPAMFLGVLLFFLVHSIFPNKQERFILPMFPFLIILGTIGWKSWVASSGFWNRHSSILNGCWNFFWIINIIAALFMGINYSKKDRVAPLHFLSGMEDVEAVVLEGREGGTRQTPVYYLGENALDYGQFDLDQAGYREYRNNPATLPSDVKLSYVIDRTKTLDSLKQEFERMHRPPNYIIFYREDNLDERIRQMSELFPGKKLEFVEEYEPSMLDKLLNSLNPRIHKRNITRIYKVVPDPQ